MVAIKVQRRKMKGCKGPGKVRNNVAISSNILG
jgi:hypothetical protein